MLRKDFLNLSLFYCLLPLDCRLVVLLLTASLTWPKKVSRSPNNPYRPHDNIPTSYAILHITSFHLYFLPSNNEEDWVNKYMEVDIIFGHHSSNYKYGICMSVFALGSFRFLVLFFLLNQYEVLFWYFFNWQRLHYFWLYGRWGDWHI